MRLTASSPKHRPALALVAPVLLAATLSGVLALAAAPAAADDWPQWRGPQRTGISAETGWRTDWTAAPPKVLWKASVGVGYSTFSVAGGRAYTLGNADDKDTVFCLNADTGAEVWKHSYPCETGPDEYTGTRATPTVDGQVVYTLSRTGDLYALAADTGKVLWNANVATQVGAKKPRWAFAGSPLVLGDRLILDLGPIVALEKSGGKLVWKGGEDLAAYGSPFAFKMGDKTLVASFNDFGPVVVDAADGKVLGKSRWKTEYGVNAVTPIVVDNTFFISSGYNRGAAVFEIAPDGLKTVWENKSMRNHANNCVLWNGFLYGFDGQVDQGGLTCIAYKTGEKKWAQKDVRAGGLLVADGKLIAMSSNGELVLAEAAPDAFKELGRTKALPGKDAAKCWTMPVLSGGRIFCRDHAGNVVCLDVRGK